MKLEEIEKEFNKIQAAAYSSMSPLYIEREFLRNYGENLLAVAKTARDIKTYSNQFKKNFPELDLYNDLEHIKMFKALEDLENGSGK